MPSCGGRRVSRNGRDEEAEWRAVVRVSRRLGREVESAIAPCSLANVVCGVDCVGEIISRIGREISRCLTAARDGWNICRQRI